MSAEEATPTGVYYHVKDYVGVTRRLLIDFIDVPVAVTLSALVVVPAWTVLPGVDEHPGVALLIRQAIRDKFAGTYVVRLDATPAGSAPIRVRTYMFWGMTFLFREVRGGAP